MGLKSEEPPEAEKVIGPVQSRQRSAIGKVEHRAGAPMLLHDQMSRVAMPWKEKSKWLRREPKGRSQECW